MKIILGLLWVAMLAISVGSCKKENPTCMQYFEVGFKTAPADWRDSAFVVATANPALIAGLEAQLLLPVQQRKIVSGKLVPGDGGYNKNATHRFKWHFKEDDWTLSDISIEIYDGRPYSDLDLHNAYWMDTVKRFSPWSAYISKKVVP
jgi:hypothetical protein